ncbi:MAG: radical SAM family heme chaperone HemW, partial [Pseudodonghicola sp.]
MAEDWRNGGFGLYVHWPFCQAKCPYCDFNSHVSREIDQSAWVRAYLSELERSGAETPGRVLNSIFFGGGTPSLMAPETVAAVIEAARKHWIFANDIEITLEANPGSVEAGRFAGFRDAGVNRVSMGVQALNDTDLRRLGRIHTVAEARTAFDIARTCFDRVSFDLIYARQDQTLDAWRAELTQALDMALDHLSLYQLTIEQGTAFGDRYNAGKLRGLPDDDLSADMYFATQEICGARGLPAYEVSNHARPGAESRHNLIYWRYGDYVGVGPGAHGRVTLNGQRLATESFRNPTRWLEAVSAGSGESVRTALRPQDQANEYLMMGMRLTEGLDMGRFAALSGAPLPTDRMDYLSDLGMITVADGRLTVTGDGRPVLNAVI